MEGGGRHGTQAARDLLTSGSERVAAPGAVSELPASLHLRSETINMESTGYSIVRDAIWSLSLRLSAGSGGSEEAGATELSHSPGSRDFIRSSEGRAPFKTSYFRNFPLRSRWAAGS